MKALAIRQPWAWAITHGGKNIENRDWLTRYRGPILIHASIRMTRDDYCDFLLTANRIMHDVRVVPKFCDLQRGGIIGRAEIVDCVEEHPSPWFFGRYGFLLNNARPLSFLPLKGQLMIFDVPDALLPEGYV